MGINKYTTEDIARELGLSRSTVSKALNNNPVVKKATRDRVLQKAAELNFQPNRAARAMVKNRNYVIAVVLFSEPEYFWNTLLQGIQQAQQEFECFGIQIELYRPSLNYPEEQIKILDELADREIDVLAIAPISPRLITEKLKTFHMKNIPIITINIDIERDLRKFYIGCNYVHAGETAGALMGKLVKTGKVAIFSFFGENEATHERVKGFCNSLESFSGITLIPTFYFPRTGEHAIELSRDFLNYHTDIKGLFISFSIVDEVALVLEELGRSDISLIGYDLSPKTEEYLERGTVDAVICQEPFNQGYFSIKYIATYLLDGVLPQCDTINTKCEVVIWENLQYYSLDSTSLYI